MKSPTPGSGSFPGQPLLDGQPGEPRDRAHVELAHQRVAVRLDRPDADAERGPDLATGFAVGDVREDLQLSRRQYVRGPRRTIAGRSATVAPEGRREHTGHLRRVVPP